MGRVCVFVCACLKGKDMYLVLENNMLNLVDPMDRSVLHSQPIASIRVWGVGRDNGRLVVLVTAASLFIPVVRHLSEILVTLASASSYIVHCCLAFSTHG